MNRFRYILSRYIRKIANRIMPKEKGTKISYPNLGAESLPKDAPRALVFFVVSGIQRMVEGKGMDDPVFKRHTIPGDGVSMVKELNKAGYIVDYCDLWRVTGKDIPDWSNYDLVIDNLDNLKYAPTDGSVARIAFMNGTHWLFHNQSELKRTQWFRDRTGITVPANRQLAPYLSDEYADYLTYYGTDYQLTTFSDKPKPHLINLCALSGDIPEYKQKDYSKARNKFIWLSGGGMLFKGADIIIEAFAKMPEAEIHICGNLEQEPEFWQWAKPIIDKHDNIHYEGWVDTTSKEFDDLANQCSGIVYASSTEGGPGTVARMLFNGCIPIVTKTSFVRAEHLGFMIEGETDQAIIDSTVEQVKRCMQLSDDELKTKAQTARDFAMKNHTREAFNESFRDLITKIKQS